MKFRSILAGAIALALWVSAAFAQTSQGTSPLTPTKGGTNSAFVGFTGPASSIKTFTLPNASDTIATLAAIQTFSAAKTFNASTLLLAGSSSGTTTLNASAAASGVLTLPAATDTLVARNTTDTLTNKTLTSPTLTTPSLGVATATSINKVAITAPATSATLTIPDGVTLTGPASSGTAMTLGNTETVTGVKTFGSSGAVGRLRIAGTTSGSTIIDAAATASGTLTLPAATDTLLGKATTDTLTNKTFDTAGTGNSFSINGLAATANTGTGAVARATSPVFVTPTLGAATATSLNGNFFTAGTYTLAGAASKTFTFSNTLTVAGTDGTTITFQGTDTYVGRTTTDTLTNKTLASPAISGPTITGTADVQQAVSLSGDISPAQLSANTNDWAPTGFSTASTIRFSTDASRNITGLAGGADGRIVILHNIGAQNAVLINNSGSSSAGNKFLIGSDITLAADTSITLRYDATSTAWRAITTPGSGGGGGGSVTSVTVAASYPVAVSGTCTITTSGTCTAAYVGPTRSGRLAYSSATAITFTPFDGDLLRINGVVFQIPSAGIAGCANTSVFVNGTGSSNLGSSTFYYVYAFSNSGTVTCDFRTDGNGHLPDDTSGNIGTEVRVSSGTTRDSTRTLIGMVRTNGSSQFANSASQRFVRSWFNRVPAQTSNKLTATRNTASTTFVEINSEIRNEFLIWSDEVVSAAFAGSAYNSATTGGLFSGISVDGSTTPQDGSAYAEPSAANAVQNQACSTTISGLSEGYHYLTLIGKVGSGTGNWYFVTSAVLPALTAIIR